MSALEALAFDMYGTLVDPIRIWKQLERYLPDDAQRIAELWRQKQLEFTFRLKRLTTRWPQPDGRSIRIRSPPSWPSTTTSSALLMSNLACSCSKMQDSRWSSFPTAARPCLLRS